MAKTKTASAFMPVTPTTATLCISSGTGIAAKPIGIPRKAGEENGAQPFGDAEAEGKRRDAADAVAPEQPGDASARP